MTLVYIVLGTLVAGMGSVLIAALIARALLARYTQHLLSLAAGALLATAFMHLLPEAFESGANAHWLFTTLLAGVLMFFLLDKAELWHHGHEHHHGDPHRSQAHDHGPVGHDHGRHAHRLDEMSTAETAVAHMIAELDALRDEVAAPMLLPSVATEAAARMARVLTQIQEDLRPENSPAPPLPGRSPGRTRFRRRVSDSHVHSGYRVHHA